MANQEPPVAPPRVSNVPADVEPRTWNDEAPDPVMYPVSETLALTSRQECSGVARDHAHRRRCDARKPDVPVRTLMVTVPALVFCST
jgi:hypothetical protein